MNASLLYMYHLSVGFCLTGPILLCIDSFVFMFVYSMFIFLYCMLCYVPGGIEAQSFGPCFPSVL